MNKFKSENYLKEESFIAYHQEFFERNKGSLEFTFDNDVKSGILEIKGE